MGFCCSGSLRNELGMENDGYSIHCMSNKEEVVGEITRTKISFEQEAILPQLQRINRVMDKKKSLFMVVKLNLFERVTLNSVAALMILTKIARSAVQNTCQLYFFANMKMTIFTMVSLLFLLGGIAKGQDLLIEKDIQINSDEGSFDKIERLSHWDGFELTVNWLGDKKGNNANLPLWMEQDLGKSIGFRINGAEKKFAVHRNGSGFLTGLGLGMDSYAWRKNVSLSFNNTAAPDSLVGVFLEDVDFSKNELHVWKLYAPILFEWNIGKSEKRHFHIATGVIGNWRFASGTKQAYTNPQGDFEVKNANSFGMRTFNADFTVRAGIGRNTFFVTVPTQTLFKSHVTQPVYHFSAGFSLFPFDSDEEFEKRKEKLKGRWKI